MTIETKELVISEELKRKVEMICRFAYVEYSITNGNIKSIKNINIVCIISIPLEKSFTLLFIIPSFSILNPLFLFRQSFKIYLYLLE